MRVAVTGATGFIGRYIVGELVGLKHTVRCWHRPESDRSGFDAWQDSIEWVTGSLGDESATRELVAGCDAVIHAALERPGKRFMGGEGSVVEFVQKNVLGTLQLIEAARGAGVGRFVFISTCAVHDKILGDRALDETHPLWAYSHYGAHKAAIEKFVHSYGLGMKYPICAVRPTGVYGVAHPPTTSKWFGLVQQIVRGEAVTCERGGKEVHAADVAKAARLLLTADGIAGEAFNCYDLYVSEYDVASIAKQISGSRSTIHGGQTTPKNEIVTAKLRGLGMQFGGRPLLEQTIAELVAVAHGAAD